MSELILGKVRNTFFIDETFSDGTKIYYQEKEVDGKRFITDNFNTILHLTKDSELDAEAFNAIKEIGQAFDVNFTDKGELIVIVEEEADFFKALSYSARLKNALKAIICWERSQKSQSILETLKEKLKNQPAKE